MRSPRTRRNDRRPLTTAAFVPLLLLAVLLAPGTASASAPAPSADPDGAHQQLLDGATFNSNPDNFDWGYCTWWVASRRSVPWSGDAIAWYDNARALGYGVGYEPVPGSILVRHSASATWAAYGHVAYVEWVDGTTFGVSEMNVVGFGEVSTRTYDMYSNPPPGLIGFIYWYEGGYWDEDEYWYGDE